MCIPFKCQLFHLVHFSDNIYPKIPKKKNNKIFHVLFASFKYEYNHDIILFIKIKVNIYIHLDVYVHIMSFGSFGTRQKYFIG